MRFLRSWRPAILILLTPASASSQIRLSVPDVTVGSGSESVEVGVVLDSPELHVAGTQNDIIVEPPLRFARRTNGRPDCAVNPTINKSGTSFAFLDKACGDGGCEAMRALVLALDNVDAIAVPAELYRCRLVLDYGANDAYPVHLANAGASDPNDNFLAVETIDGSIDVSSVTEGAEFVIGDVSVCGHVRGTIEATYTFGPSLTQASHIVRFEAEAPIASDGTGHPSCVPVEPLGAEDATFAFVPDGCIPGSDCDGVQVFLRDIDTPALGAVPLYRCDVEPAPFAEVGSHALRCTDARAGNAGIPSLTATCHDGSFTIGGCQSTPTAEQTVTPTATVAAPAPTATAVHTDPVFGGGDGGDDGGCAIAAASDGGGWLLLTGLCIAAAAGISRRRRCAR